MNRKSRTRTTVNTMLPGQRKKPPSLLYPPTTHAVCDSANAGAANSVCFMNVQNPRCPSPVCAIPVRNLLNKGVGAGCVPQLIHDDGRAEVCVDGMDFVSRGGRDGCRDVEIFIDL